MNDFDYDVLQKKRIASGARHKVNGVKSSKCTLPQDYMTAKQLRERNGEIMTYNMDKPTTWKEFKFWPRDIQKQYLEHLNSLGGSNEEIGGMMGTSGRTIGTLAKALGAEIRDARQFTNADKKKWQKFIEGEPDEPAEEAASEPVEEPVKEEKYEPTACYPATGHLEYTGHSYDVFAAALRAVGERKIHIHISFEGVDE